MSYKFADVNEDAGVTQANVYFKTDFDQLVSHALLQVSVPTQDYSSHRWFGPCDISTYMPHAYGIRMFIFNIFLIPGRVVFLITFNYYSVV